jgi:hypothetical protein
MNGNNEAAWKPVFDVNTPDDAFETSIVEHVGAALWDLTERVCADPDLTPAQRAAILEQAAPWIRAQTRRAFLSARARLRAEQAGH